MQTKYSVNPQVLCGVGILVLLVSATVVFAQEPSPNYRWIIAADALSNIQQLDPELANTYFNSSSTFVQSVTSPPTNQVPSGWSAIPNGHYTSYESCGTAGGCTSLETDIGNAAINPAVIPTVMFDDENWSKTPKNEQQNPVEYIDEFVQLAHGNGFTTIMAPDQNLASPKNGITGYQDGESENWQTYLRLGLGTKAAASGTDGYHIMAQSFETYWCGNPEGNCQGSEADFLNYVTQAALQAGAVNPNLKMTAGLSTNPRYNATPQALYQDTLDANNVFPASRHLSASQTDGYQDSPHADSAVPSPGYWLNVLGGAGAAVQYLELLSGMMPLYPSVGQGLSSNFPLVSTQGTFSLSTGASLTSVSSNTFRSGTVIPAGEYKFEPWTDGSGGSDVLTIDAGYCTPPSCANPVSFLRNPGEANNESPWTVNVGAGDPGITSTFTTSSPTRLPAGGPYNIYFNITVQSSTNTFNLLYNAVSTPTNLALPRPSLLAAMPNTTVLFAGHDGRLVQNEPSPDNSSQFSLDQAGSVLSFTTPKTFAAGQIIPSGAWEFQFWTSGTSDGQATLKLEFGYCVSSCTLKTAIINSSAGWNPTIAGGSSGVATQKGAFTTASSTTLPAGGPYQLYFTVTVQNPGSFNLLYGSAATPTNVATPFVIPNPHSIEKGPLW